MQNSTAERYSSNLSFHLLTRTIELDFGNVYDREQYPTRKEIFGFLLDELELTTEMVDSV